MLTAGPLLRVLSQLPRSHLVPIFTQREGLWEGTPGLQGDHSIQGLCLCDLIIPDLSTLSHWLLNFTMWIWGRYKQNHVSFHSFLSHSCELEDGYAVHIRQVLKKVICGHC